MTNEIVWCINTYVHGTDSRLPSATHARCPECHKILKIMKDGRLYPHGVRRKDEDHEDRD